jgi:hypothetical protein
VEFQSARPLGVMALQEGLLARGQYRVPIIGERQARQFDLNAHELCPLRLLVLFQPVGVDQTHPVVIGVIQARGGMLRCQPWDWS